MYKPHYSIILSNVGSCSDRFMSEGYSDPFTVDELFDRVSSIEHVEGVELIGDTHISTQNINQIKDNLSRTGLKAVSIIPNHSLSRKWGKGSFSSKDQIIRKDAIAHTKEMMDIASEIGCEIVSIWPGQDGYDYYFQADYIEERLWLEEGIKECCKHRKDIKVSIEYKIKEPRNRSYLSTVSNTLLMINEIDEENCGVTIDFGHALEAYENPAESVALLKRHGDKLFHIHMNDNYTLWDDDMITGSVHTIQYIEFFYWLKRTDYKGWISIDQYPYREDGKEAATESMMWLAALNKVMEKMNTSEVENVIKKGNASEACKMIRKYLMGE